MVTTSIQISKELLDELKKRKLYSKETYEDLIWDLLEDSMELSDETKNRIAQAEAEIKAGHVVSLKEVEARLKR